MKFKLKVGDRNRSAVALKPEVVRDFMAITGDNNPVHWNEDYCELSSFEAPSAHESLIIAIISSAIGSKLPGKGSVITNINIQFLAPTPYLKWSKGRMYDIDLLVHSINSDGSIDIKVKFGRCNQNKRSATKYPNIEELIAEGMIRVKNIFDMEIVSNVKN